MKKRNGFVSNSSTSSFICQICGETDVIYDDGCEEDSIYISCEKGHNFCASHLFEGAGMHKVVKDIPEEHIISEEEEDYTKEKYAGHLKKEYCPICNFKCVALEDKEKFFDLVYNIKTNEDFVNLLKRNGISSYDKFKMALKERK